MRSSSPVLPLCFVPLMERESWACLHVSCDERDKSAATGEMLLKNGLKRSFLRGCNSCSIFISVFTFISTRLKCVTIFSPPCCHAPTVLDLTLTLDCKQMLSRRAMFRLTSITEARPSQAFTCQPGHISCLMKSAHFLQATEKLIKVLLSCWNKLYNNNLHNSILLCCHSAGHHGWEIMPKNRFFCKWSLPFI